MRAASCMCWILRRCNLVGWELAGKMCSSRVFGICMALGEGWCVSRAGSCRIVFGCLFSGWKVLSEIAAGDGFVGTPASVGPVLLYAYFCTRTFVGIYVLAVQALVATVLCYTYFCTSTSVHDVHTASIYG